MRFWFGEDEILLEKLPVKGCCIFRSGMYNDVVGRLDEGQLGSAGGLVAE
jgi:hypothetical protein